MNLASSIGTLLTQAFEYAGEKAVIVYDRQSFLSEKLAAAYRECLPEALAIDFDQTRPETILEIFQSLSRGDLVVLIQSTSFRLDAFRIRVHLFEKGLKVIEHPHVGRIRDYEYDTYVDSLAYDSTYYRTLGPVLKERLDRSQEVVVHSGKHRLTYGGPMEPAKLNIGDYRGMKNTGGQFPIGEVFTELRDLRDLNGSVELFAFGGQDFSVVNCEPEIVLHIEQGQIMDANPTTPAFDAILKEIRDYEGALWVRELGFGLNRALTYERRIQYDVGTYERMCGVHLSLGGKHTIYPKEGFHKKKVKYHVDVFVKTTEVRLDGAVIYSEGRYVFNV